MAPPPEAPEAPAAPLLLTVVTGLIVYVSLYPFRFVPDGPALAEAQGLPVARFAGEAQCLIEGLLRAGHFPIGLGGGHEIAWAAYQGIERALAGDAK